MNYENPNEKILPIGCIITNIRRGKVEQGREHNIYCELHDKNGMLIISADLAYITERLKNAQFISQEEFDKLFK